MTAPSSPPPILPPVAGLTPPQTGPSRLFMIIGAAMVSFFVWSNVTTLDRIAPGQGRFTPAGKVQTVQPVEGGVVIELLARDGQLVQAGQLLARIRNTSVVGDLESKQATEQHARLRAARLEAEGAGKAAIEWPLDAPAALRAAEERLFRERGQRLANERAGLAAQADARRQAMQEARARIAAARAALGNMGERLRIQERMVQEQFGSRADLLKMRQEADQLRGDLTVAEQSLPRLASEAESLDARLRELESRFRADALRELNDVRQELATLGAALSASGERQDRTDLAAPVRGVVNNLQIRGLGAVVRSGDTLMEIVPIDDTLLVETRVRPEHIGHLRPGMAAVVKVSAYDYALYGSLKGKVEQIAADASADNAGAYYRAYVRTPASLHTPTGQDLALIPGMTCDVSFIIGQRSVMDYLIKPVSRLWTDALREP